MKVFACTEESEIAQVFIADTGRGRWIEFLESTQRPLPREQKWVLIISTLYGCPVNCPICDAGGFYKGKLGKDEMLAQIDFLITRRYPSRIIPVEKFKIQFARMGEPSYNPGVLEVLRDLPGLYEAPGLIPCISTIAPQSNGDFFEKLLEIKQGFYIMFQLQFSIHSTDESVRDRLIPCRKWDFRKIADYGERFYAAGERRITLNFALAKDVPVDGKVLLKYFDPDKFLIKITPVNPTYNAAKNNIDSCIVKDAEKKYLLIMDELASAGYRTILSIGELTENNIGSNCGQYITKHLQQADGLEAGYTYETQTLDQSYKAPLWPMNKGSHRNDMA